MVMKEFLRRRVAPLQRHSQLMCALSIGPDRMMLKELELPLEARRTMLEVLAGNPSPGDMPPGGCLLYGCSNRVEFVGQMPPSMNGACIQSALKGLARTLSPWFPSLPPAPNLPQEWMQGGEHRWRPMGQVSRC